jgi:hypothetical protein
MPFSPSCQPLLVSVVATGTTKLRLKVSSFSHYVKFFLRNKKPKTTVPNRLIRIMVMDVCNNMIKAIFKHDYMAGLKLSC